MAEKIEKIEKTETLAIEGPSTHMDVVVPDRRTLVHGVMEPGGTVTNTVHGPGAVVRMLRKEALRLLELAHVVTVDAPREPPAPMVSETGTDPVVSSPRPGVST